MRSCQKGDKIKALEKEKAELLKRVGFLERAIKSNEDELEAKKETRNGMEIRRREKPRFLSSQKLLEKEAFEHSQFISIARREPRRSYNWRGPGFGKVGRSQKCVVG